MTSHAPKPTPRKRLLLFTVLSAVILAIAWITYFLVNFDLNNYRQQAEERLSSLLSLSVKIGEVRYSLNDTNLALRVVNLQIGDEDSTIQIDAPDILMNLQWRGLLERNFKFTKISLAQPHIWVRPDINVQIDEDSVQTKHTSLMIDLALLHKISIDDLKIISGVVEIETSRPGQPVQQVKLTELDGEFTDIRLNQVSQFTIKGELRLPGRERKSPWQLQGESSLKLDDRKGLVPHFNLDLNVKNLDLSTLGAALVKQPASYSITGISDLHLHIEGSPTGSIDFQTGLLSNNIALSPGPTYSHPIHFKHLSASGRLETHGDHPGISNLSLRVDDSRLTGAIDWTPHGQPSSTTITLLNSNLTVSQIKQWLPDEQEPLPAIRQRLLDQGSIQIERAEFTLFENSRSQIQGSQIQGRIDRLKGELLHVAWDLENAPAAEIISLPFDFADNLWQINNGQGKLGSHQLTVNGTGEYNEGEIVFTSLDFSSEVLPSKLLEEWHLPSQHALTTSGKVVINGHIEGSLNWLNLDLQADLSQFSIGHPAGLKLTPGAKDNLTLHATLTPQKVSLDHGAFRWSFLKGHLSGTYIEEDPDSLVIDALLTVNDLTRLAEAFPLLDEMQLHGQADLSINQRGLPENNPPEMILTLRDAGLSATSHIAALSLINGRVQLTPTGLVADNLRVHLGKSALIVQVQLADFTNPRLILDVRAPSIRADELIFYSDKATLRDINGHLEIDRNGLSFAPVDVRLDGGTKASVRGTISFHSPFDVRLDITSEFARISEVVNLWSDQSGTKKKRPESGLTESAGAEPQATVRIHAQVKRGDLYGMSFHDASGVIVPTRERLSIHPLDFSVGEGYCNAQILTEFSPGAPTLLRISGHAEEVDALRVYRELLNQKNIVRGKLRGDFYLYGEIGSNYLPSSYGNFSIQIHDGVLHQFQTLSKVFSLLNVSQIFALQLPDMDLEGMPFDTLSANFQLDKGVIRSEDLKIQSEAMNQVYIGELNLIDKELDLTVTIHPLGTVDKVVSHIPVAGWLLTGEDKALLTARFAIEGQVGDASVTLMPLDTLTKPTIGLLRRTLELPFKLFKDPQILWGGDASDEAKE